jgi:hypothetical protein
MAAEAYLARRGTAAALGPDLCIITIREAVVEIDAHLARLRRVAAGRSADASLKGSESPLTWGSCTVEPGFSRRCAERTLLSSTTVPKAAAHRACRKSSQSLGWLETLPG